MFDLSLLGIVQNIPKVNFVDYSGVFIAPPKFGKTTTASKFPNSVIVPFEDGTKGQVVNVAKTVKDWASFIKFIDDLATNREAIGDQIQTIVIDTVNKAYDKCEKYTLRKMSIADKKKYTKMSDVAHGGAYPVKDKNFADQLDRIYALGFNILFISHSKVKTIRPKGEEPYDVYSSTMPDRLEAIVNPLVDFILYGEKRQIEGVEKRVLVTKGASSTDAGGRVYIEEDIVFDTEDEAIQKYQVLFKQSVQRKLDENGITRNIDEISKEQMEEKMEKVMEYVGEKSDTSFKKESVLEEISSYIAKMDTEQQSELKKLFKSEFGSVAYKKFEEREKIEKALEIAKGIIA